MRLYGSGVPTLTITQLVKCSDRRIREWSQKYREKGLAGLKSGWQGENALKLSREQRTDLKARLEMYRPDQVIGAEVRIRGGQFWTVSDLQIVVQQWYVRYRRLLHECRLSYQHTESVYRSRPDDLRVANFEAELEKK